MPIEEPAEHEQQLEHPTVADTQRPQAPAANKSLTQEGNRGKTSIVKSTTTKRKMPHAQDQFSSTIDKISTLPPEILKMILDNVRRGAQGIIIPTMLISDTRSKTRQP